MTAEFNINS